MVGLEGALSEEPRLDDLKTIKIVTIEPRAVDTPWWDHASNHSGHTPRMAAMDDPEEVVDAIVWASIHPREEVAVGWKAKASIISHQLMPGLTTDTSGNIVHCKQIEG